MTRDLQDDCRRSPLIQMTSLGKSASGSRTIWLVRIGFPETPKANPRKMFVLCRQHGDEPASTEALLRLTRQVAAHGLSAWPGGKSAVLYAVPMVNPDGADAGTRPNAAGADLNRDWGVFRQPETRAVYKALKVIHPNLVLDLHSWDASDPFKQMCIEGPRASRSSGLTTALMDFETRAANAQNASERIAATSYGAEADMTLCHRYFWTVKHTPALLFETDAGSDTPDLLAQRTMAAYRFLTWALADAAKPHACWTQFAKAAPSSHETLFPRVDNAPPETAQIAPKKPRPAWEVWGALICFGVGVFWRYGTVRRESKTSCRKKAPATPRGADSERTPARPTDQRPKESPYPA